MPGTYLVVRVRGDGEQVKKKTLVPRVTQYLVIKTNVVVLTLTHGYNAIRSRRTGFNNSGAENYLRRKNDFKTEDNTHTKMKLKQIVYLSKDKNKKVRSAYLYTKYVSVDSGVHIIRMLNESQQKPKPRRLYYKLP